MAETTVTHFHRYSPTQGFSGWWWRAVCGCGWVGRDRTTEADAISDGLQHRCAAAPEVTDGD